MPRLWARTVSFETINAGDTLPILVKWETQETITNFISLLLPEAAAAESAAEGSADASGDLAADLAAPAPALLAYVTELLEKAFPVARIMAPGSQLELELLSPVRPEDTISLTGQVVGKREEKDLRFVDCAVFIENQDGQAVARATATVSL